MISSAPVYYVLYVFKFKPKIISCISVARQKNTNLVRSVLKIAGHSTIIYFVHFEPSWSVCVDVAKLCYAGVCKDCKCKTGNKVAHLFIELVSALTMVDVLLTERVAFSLHFRFQSDCCEYQIGRFRCSDRNGVLWWTATIVTLSPHWVVSFGRGARAL